MISKKRSFKKWDNEEYPKVSKKQIKFPKDVYIAYAVCGQKCGNKEFIVDGQTQVCEYCGKLMFRTEVKKYVFDKLI